MARTNIDAELEPKVSELASDYFRGNFTAAVNFIIKFGFKSAKAKLKESKAASDE